MYNVKRANGDTFEPPMQRGSGRPGKYPFAYLEVGDHFVAPWDDIPSIDTMISQGRKFGREHDRLRGYELGTCMVVRIS
ncbi:hypothetical protein OKA06_01460 [Novosphingobium sp. MW5]|nr:hypothetical protein [Novosphingobium sp. MW5]